ncbi:DUF7544 domain-containing protein [Halopiger thermotolerans]
MDAVDDLSDALDATRRLLLPVRPALWLKLALVAFFVGGFGVSNPGVATSGNPEMVPQDPSPSLETGPGDVPDDVLVVAAIVLAVALLLWVLFEFVGAIMEFVFIESLRSTTVRVRQYARANVGRGVRLFLFRALVGLAALALVGIPAALLVSGASTVEAALASLAPVVLLAVPVGLVYGVVMRFTTEFVAPIMLLEDRGVLGAWGRFWPTLRSNPAEYAVYLVLVWILRLVVTVGAGAVALFGAIVVAIPFLAVGFVLVLLGGVGVWIAGGLAVLGALAILLVVALVQLPIPTYFQYYALLLLGDTNADLDLVSDLRREIRTADRDRRNGLGSPYPDDRRERADRDRPADEDRDDWWNEGHADDRDADGWDSNETDDRDSSRSDDEGEGDRGW